MKRNVLSFIALTSLISVVLFSCVPARQYQDMKAKKESCISENAKLKADNEKLVTDNTELNAKFSDMNRRFVSLQTDTMILGTSLRRAATNYEQLNRTYELLFLKNKELLAGNVSETQKLSTDLQLTQENLLKKEDELKRMEKDLNALGKELNDKKTNLDELTLQLQKKEQKIFEMQTVLNRKDSTVKALKDKVSEALNSYVNNGLTVVQKNGKVYVSLDEKLLFASGSFSVDAKGVEALKKLGKVLDNNTDVNIMIEGHTDNVPYSGAGQLKDNWDLSVMRATTIVKILLANSKIDPRRLTAAGRGEYIPVDSNVSKEGRAKNRRTEIILTPKMDELFKVLESN